MCERALIGKKRKQYFFTLTVGMHTGATTCGTKFTLRFSSANEMSGFMVSPNTHPSLMWTRHGDCWNSTGPVLFLFGFFATERVHICRHLAKSLLGANCNFLVKATSFGILVKSSSVWTNQVWDRVVLSTNPFSARTPFCDFHGMFWLKVHWCSFH